MANASRFKAGLQVAGVLSGAKLSVMSGANAYIMSNLGVGTTAPRTKLEVTGVISGAKLSVPGTITLRNVSYLFPQFDGSATGKVLKTDGAGNLSWSADNDSSDGITYANAVSYFVDDSGDTMTGALTVKRVSGTYQDLLTVSGGRIVVKTTAPNNDVNLLDVSGGSLKVSGNINATGTILSVGSITTRGDLTLNADQTNADTVLTFGSDGSNETLKLLNATDRFEFSNDLNVTGSITTSGALVVNNASRIKAGLQVAGVLSGAKLNIMSGANAYIMSNVGVGTTAPRTKLEVTGVISGAKLSVPGTVTLSNVAYTFPQFDGSASGKVLKTNAAGQLSWSDDKGGRNSGSMISLSPGYPGAIYFGSGAPTTSVGTLGLRYDSGSTVNFYRWQSTKTSNQQYWIVTRVRIPDHFSGWQGSKPIEFRYRASGAWLEVRALDTANNVIALTGHSSLKATTWTTATITGPEVSGTFASGSYMTLMVKMVSSGALVPDRAYADASFINLNMETTK